VLDLITYGIYLEVEKLDVSYRPIFVSISLIPPVPISNFDPNIHVKQICVNVFSVRVEIWQPVRMGHFVTGMRERSVIHSFFRNGEWNPGFCIVMMHMAFY
jgi:hypothetical protein